MFVVLEKVGDRSVQTINTLTEAPNATIAAVAEKASHLAGRMIVVDGQIHAFAASWVKRRLVAAANGATAVLLVVHGLVLLLREAVQLSVFCGPLTLAVSWLQKPKSRSFGEASPANTVASGSVASFVSPREKAKCFELVADSAMLAFGLVVSLIRRIALHRNSLLVLVSGHGC